MALLILAGILVNGPYALITTVVSAELGTHPSLGGNSRALATVTAIIDGTGSIGAAVGPLLAGLISNWAGWHNVFYLLMAADAVALLVSIENLFRYDGSFVTSVDCFSAASKAGIQRNKHEYTTTAGRLNNDSRDRLNWT